MKDKKYFRNRDGEIKEMLSHVEGISFRESPLDFFILLARYKFAARLVSKKDDVLDAGCGHGLGTVFLSRFGRRVTGIDSDRELIERNQKEYARIRNVNFVQMDLTKKFPGSGTFDAVVSMDVIEHFTPADAQKVVRNYRKLTKAGGFAVIGTPNIISEPYASKRRKETHLHEYSPEEFIMLLSKHFKRVFLFSMTDETVSTSFNKLAWYLMAVCTT